MEILEVRTWIVFYLLSFVALLVAVFITTQNDSQRWISLTLVIVVVGVNLYLLLTEIKRHQDKKTFVLEISRLSENEPELEDFGRRW